MNNLIVLDFDGVIFPNPNSLHKYVLAKHTFSYAVKLFIESEGRIPDHFYEKNNLEGQKYIDAFYHYYFSLRLSDSGIERIRILSQKHILCIASYNEEMVMRKILHLSGVESLFDEIFSLEKQIGNKTIAFENLADQYSIETSDLSFITDTVSDIKEAKKAGVRDIYAVAADKDPCEYLLQYISRDKIIPGFY